MIKKELARRKLIAVDRFVLPHLLHQLVGTKGVHEAERSCKQEDAMFRIIVRGYMFNG